MKPPAERDLSTTLRSTTDARVAVGRAGASLPTAAHLQFVGDHASARDAVWTPADFDSLATALGALGLDVLRLHSQAADRAIYLRRPDLGRLLAPESEAKLAERARMPSGPVALVVADGLSAEAIHQNAVPVVAALLPRLAKSGVPVQCAALVEQGRVAVGDPVAEALGAQLVVVLIGERPGLSAADSLGCYVTWSPQLGTPDSARNCISNIRARGLAPNVAAQQIATLVLQALHEKRTGVGLATDFSATVLK